MSSHHVIRENQEPAVYFRHPEEVDSWLDLLEWGPLVLGNAQTIPLLKERDVFIDVAIGVDKEEIPANIQQNWLEEILKWLINRKHQELHILGRTSKEELLLAHKAGLVADAYFDHAQHVLITSFPWKKWMAKGMKFQYAGKVDKVIFQSAEWITKSDTIIPLEKDGLVEIQGVEPIMLTHRYRN